MRALNAESSEGRIEPDVWGWRREAGTQVVFSGAGRGGRDPGGEAAAGRASRIAEGRIDLLFRNRHVGDHVAVPFENFKNFSSQRL